MESRAYALITGLFVLGIAGCIVAWAHWLAKTPIARTSYRVVSTLPVSGLNPEAQVRYRGMGVGRVSAIGLDPKDPRRIVVDIEVDNGIPVTKGTYAQLGMEGITGIAYVHLLDDYKDMAPAPKAADGVAELQLRPAFLDTITDSAEGAVRDARALMTSLNGVITAENRERVAATLASLQRVTANLESASARLPSVLARADAVLSEENARSVGEAVRALPELSRELRELAKDGRALVAQAARAAAEAQGAAAAVREESLPRVDALADSVDRGAQRVGRLALQLDRDPQSALFGRRPGRPGPGEPGFQ